MCVCVCGGGGGTSVWFLSGNRRETKRGWVDVVTALPCVLQWRQTAAATAWRNPEHTHTIGKCVWGGGGGGGGGGGEEKGVDLWGNLVS